MMFCIYMCTFSCKQFLVSTDNVKILLILKNYLMKRDKYLILSQRISNGSFSICHEIIKSVRK